MVFRLNIMIFYKMVGDQNHSSAELGFWLQFRSNNYKIYCYTHTLLNFREMLTFDFLIF